MTSLLANLRIRQSASLLGGQSALHTSHTCRAVLSRSTGRLRVRAESGQFPGETTKETSRPDQGSFGKIESPVRDTKPDTSSLNVEDRDTDKALRSPELNRDTEWFGTEVGFLDGMRFYGAIPEVNNCRLAMLGFFAALIAEFSTGKNVFQQIQSAPGPIAAVFLTITLATTIPVVRGKPRRGTGAFSSDAEIINGRFAMLAFASIVVITAIRGSYLDIWPFLHK